MPKEIQFKKPNCYGVDQICEIMKHQQDIVFHLTPQTNFVDASEDTCTPTSNISQDVQKAAVVDGKVVIEESELEVIDLQLSEFEFQLLTTKCSEYFTELKTHGAC